MKLRSLLFVPGDRPDRFAKAAASGADAIIIDLEDSVALDRKAAAREAAAEYLSGDRPVPVFIRVNPQDSHLTHDDLASVLPYVPDAIVLPKAEGARSVHWLRAEAAAVADSQDGEAPLILPIATETPGAVFDLGTLREVKHYLLGVSWGAEDLPAAVGASASREADGRYTAPYEMVRSLTLFAAHAAGVAAIVYCFPEHQRCGGAGVLCRPSGTRWFHRHARHSPVAGCHHQRGRLRLRQRSLRMPNRSLMRSRPIRAQACCNWTEK